MVESQNCDILCSYNLKPPVSSKAEVNECSYAYNIYFDVLLVDCRDPSDYIHRVGRTARAGRSGRSVSFITEVFLSLFFIHRQLCSF
jgi:superfamily II DNA/RNA helicase